jgi:hypothetical protein
VRQKITAGVIALVLGSFAAIGAFASQDGLGLHVFSGPSVSDEPGVDTPTSTVTVDASATATDTATPEATETETELPSPTDTPEATETAGPTEVAAAGCNEADDDDDNHAAVGTPAAGVAHDDDCDDGHEDNGKHEGLECGKGHDGEHEGDDANEHGGGTPTAAVETPTPDANSTPTIVAEMPMHCHGEHGVEHDEGHHSGDQQKDD